MSAEWEEAVFLWLEPGMVHKKAALPPVIFTRITLGSPAVCIRDP